MMQRRQKVFLIALEKSLIKLHAIKFYVGNVKGIVCRAKSPIKHLLPQKEPCKVYVGVSLV